MVCLFFTKHYVYTTRGSTISRGSSLSRLCYTRVESGDRVPLRFSYSGKTPKLLQECLRSRFKTDF